MNIITCSPWLSRDPSTKFETSATADRIFDPVNIAQYQHFRYKSGSRLSLGIIHSLEAEFNFNTHLHNGDPLSAQTVHVPRGRPPTGNPPFQWLDSAIDALTMHDLEINGPTGR